MMGNDKHAFPHSFFTSSQPVPSVLVHFCFLPLPIHNASTNIKPDNPNSPLLNSIVSEFLSRNLHSFERR